MPPLDPEAGSLPSASLDDSPSFSIGAPSSPRRRGSTQFSAFERPGVVDSRLRGNDDADATIWRDGGFRRDAWSRATNDGALPESRVILSKKRWLAERGSFQSRSAPLGLRLEAGETVDDIAADVARFALIALDFPKYSDGRAFSTARVLREKYAYAGELRAVGNVLSDQIPLMRRVGFDTLEVTHAPTRRALVEGRIAEVSLHYQPAGIAEAPAGTRPWLRRTDQA